MNDKELQQAFLQFLAKKSGAKSQLELEKYVQSLGEDGLKQAYDEFTKVMLNQAQKAAHGAKLQYLRNLKHKCGENEELVFYKKGGSVECGCVGKKMEKGGETPKKKISSNAVKDFRGRANQQDTVHVNGRIYSTTNMDGSRNDKRFPAYVGSKAELEDRAKAKKGDKDAKKRQDKQDEVTAPKNGAKLKKAKAGCVAEFKGRRRFARGGSLNGIPFYLAGTPKGGLPTAPKAEDRYRNGRRTWNTPEYKEVSSANNIYGDPFASKIAMEVSNNGNDTTFYETPGRWLPVKSKTRTASKKNQNFRTVSYYLGLPTNETKTIIISPEYEILKRRFNTAWNLAK